MTTRRRLGAGVLDAGLQLALGDVLEVLVDRQLEIAPVVDGARRG
jgi:hypothetical protein